MKFALFGLDKETAQLAREIESSGDHEVVWVCPAGGDDVADASLTAMRASPEEDWLLSLDRSGAEVVVIARQDDERQLLAAFRQLVETRLPLVMSHPLNLSVMAYYEIERIVSEATTTVVPLLTTRWHPEIRQIVKLQQAGDLRNDAGDSMGAVRQVEIERVVADGDLPAVLRSFARDVDTIRLFSGDLAEVAALCARGDGIYALPMAAQLSGPSGILARWSASGADEHNIGARLTILGEKGKTTVNIPQDRPRGAGPGQEASAAAAAATLDGLIEQLRGPAAEQYAWRDAIQSLELTEALEKSLERGRVVRLNLDGRNESGAFKGTMASIGCALLVAAMLLLVASAVVLKFAKASGFNWLVAVVGKVPYILAGVLCVFLLIQLLRYLIPTDDDASHDP